MLEGVAMVLMQNNIYRCEDRWLLQLNPFLDPLRTSITRPLPRMLFHPGKSVFITAYVQLITAYYSLWRSRLARADFGGDREAAQELKTKEHARQCLVPGAQAVANLQ
jgi:hypothetical protein